MDPAHRLLIDQLSEGYAHCRMDWVDDRPTDFLYLAVNPAWHRLTGVQQAIGRYSAEVLPGFREKSPEAFAALARVSRGGSPERFDTTVPLQKLHLSVTAYSLGSGEFVALLTDVTVLHRQRTELEHSEDRFRRAVAATKDGVWEWNLATGEEYFSPRWCQILGYEPDDPGLERHYAEWEERIHPDDRDRVLRALQDHLKGNSEYHVEYRHRHRSGEYRWQASRGEASFDPEGNPLQMIGSISDIHERKEAEERLAASESRYRSLIEQAADGIFTSGEGGRYLDVNAAGCALLGYSREEVLALTIADLTDHTEDDPQRYVALNAGKKVISERRMLRKDGTWVEVEISSKRLSNGNYLGIVHDLSETRRTEKQLALYFENSPDLVATGTPDGTLHQVNRAWWRVLGYPIESLVGGNLFDLIHGEDRSALAVEVEHQSGGAEPRKVLTRCVTADGSFRWLEWNLAVASGRSELYAVARDVTVELRLRDELQQTQKLEALGILAAGIAHDFNNILAGLFGFIDLARLGSKEDSVVRYLDKARSAIDRARSLTRQLVTFAKGGEPEFQVLDLGPVLEETTTFALSGSPIRCRFEIDPGLPPCRFDRNLVAQVVENLVINAVQVMGQEGELSVRADRQGDFVQVRFTDQGPGISPELLGRIFDPFFTTKALGHGMGLATCYSIIRRHGGEITAESEVGRGTTLRFSLPVSPEPVTRVPSHGDLPSWGVGRFLVLDDEPAVRETLEALLVSFGFTVSTVEEGSQAVRVFHEARASTKPFGGLIFDRTIPGGLGGVETLAEILEVEPGVRALVCSGYSEDSVMTSPEKFGFVGCLKKPFTKEELHSILVLHGWL